VNIDAITRADGVSSEVHPLDWDGQTGRHIDASSHRDPPGARRNAPIHGAPDEADGGTRTPDPIITSVSGDALRAAYPVFIGISGGYPRPFSPGATLDGTQNGRQQLGARRSPKGGSAAAMTIEQSSAPSRGNRQSQRANSIRVPAVSALFTR
jgi:hypothetical protein